MVLFVLFIVFYRGFLVAIRYKHHKHVNVTTISAWGGGRLFLSQLYPHSFVDIIYCVLSGAFVALKHLEFVNVYVNVSDGYNPHSFMCDPFFFFFAINV